MKYKNPDSKTAKNNEHVSNLIVFLAVFCRNKKKLVQIKKKMFRTRIFPGLPVYFYMFRKCFYSCTDNN